MATVCEASGAAGLLDASDSNNNRSLDGIDLGSPSCAAPLGQRASPAPLPPNQLLPTASTPFQRSAASLPTDLSPPTKLKPHSSPLHNDQTHSIASKLELADAAADYGALTGLQALTKNLGKMSGGSSWPDLVAGTLGESGLSALAPAAASPLAVTTPPPAAHSGSSPSPAAASPQLLQQHQMEAVLSHYQGLALLQRLYAQASGGLNLNQLATLTALSPFAGGNLAGLAAMTALPGVGEARSDGGSARKLSIESGDSLGGRSRNGSVLSGGEEGDEKDEMDELDELDEEGELDDEAQYVGDEDDEGGAFDSDTSQSLHMRRGRVGTQSGLNMDQLGLAAGTGNGLASAIAASAASHPALSAAVANACAQNGAPNQQWGYEDQFKQLYEMSDDPSRKQFLDDLFCFMQKRGTPINRIPIMAKQTLDLYELFRLVVDRGGLVEVINKKLWREITKGLNLPSSITSAAFTLRTQYMRFLYPYECEKHGFSSQSELQVAIDGNKREGRRLGFDFTPPGQHQHSQSAASLPIASAPVAATSANANHSQTPLPRPHHANTQSPAPTNLAHSHYSQAATLSQFLLAQTDLLNKLGSNAMEKPKWTMEQLRSMFTEQLLGAASAKADGGAPVVKAEAAADDQPPPAALSNGRGATPDIQSPAPKKPKLTSVAHARAPPAAQRSSPPPAPFTGSLSQSFDSIMLRRHGLDRLTVSLEIGGILYKGILHADAASLREGH